MNNDHSLGHTKWECKYHLSKGKGAFTSQENTLATKRMLQATNFGPGVLMCQQSVEMRRQSANTSGSKKRKIEDINQLGLWKQGPVTLDVAHGF